MVFNHVFRDLGAIYDAYVNSNTRMSVHRLGSLDRLLIPPRAFGARLLQILIDTVDGGRRIAEHSMLDIDPVAVRRNRRIRLIGMTYLGP